MEDKTKMAKYAIRYEEILAKTVIVEARNSEEAVDKVLNGEVSVDYDDYDGKNAYISKESNIDGTATENQIQSCESFDD